MCLQAAYANSALLINDKKLRNYILSCRLKPWAPCNSIQNFIKGSAPYTIYPSTFYDFACIFNSLDTINRIKFLLKALHCFLKLHYVFNITNTYDTFLTDKACFVNKRVQIVIFGIKMTFHPKKEELSLIENNSYSTKRVY